MQNLKTLFFDPLNESNNFLKHFVRMIVTVIFVAIDSQHGGWDVVANHSCGNIQRLGWVGFGLQLSENFLMFGLECLLVFAGYTFSRTVAGLDAT